MAVILWWKERLAARAPIGSKVLLEMGEYNIKLRREQLQDTWPRAIARQALLMDYEEWFAKTYLENYRCVQFYIDHPEKLPKPADQLAFFTAIGPWLYIVDKRKQTKNYLVPQFQLFEERTIRVKVRRYFVRLAEWSEHVSAFELQTGLRVLEPSPKFDALQAQMVSEATGKPRERVEGT